MSIVKLVSEELPEEGRVIYADDGGSYSDRAIFKDGKFYGGGEFPFPEYEMTQVKRWFYLDDYLMWYKSKGKTSCLVSFDNAEKIED